MMAALGRHLPVRLLGVDVFSEYEPKGEATSAEPPEEGGNTTDELSSDKFVRAVQSESDVLLGLPQSEQTEEPPSIEDDTSAALESHSLDSSDAGETADTKTDSTADFINSSNETTGGADGFLVDDNNNAKDEGDTAPTRIDASDGTGTVLEKETNGDVGLANDNTNDGSIKFVSNNAEDNARGILQTIKDAISDGAPDEQQYDENGAEDNASMSWISTIVAELYGWLVSQDNDDGSEADADKRREVATDDIIWSDWEYVLSKVETEAYRANRHEAARRLNELAALRARGETLRFRRWFEHQSVRPTMRELQLQTAGLQEAWSVKLEPSKLSSMIATCVRERSNEWRQACEIVIRDASSTPELAEAIIARFRADWEESAYERNVTGALREVAFVAAGGASSVGLTPRVAAEILWALWKSLVEALRARINSETEESLSAIAANSESTQAHPSCTLQKHHFERIAAAVGDSAELLCGLYAETVRISKRGTRNAGVVVARIEREAAAEEEHIAELKAEGVSAKFSDVEARRAEIESELSRLRGETPETTSALEISVSSLQRSEMEPRRNLAEIRTLLESRLLISGVLAENPS